MRRSRRENQRKGGAGRPATTALTLAALSATLLLAFGLQPAYGQEAPAPPAQVQPPANNAPPAPFGLRAGLYGKTTLENQHYQYAVNPGAQLRDTVEVLNLSGQQRTFKLYAADLIQSTGGALSPSFPTDKQLDTGAWIKLDEPSVDLAPHGSRKIGFSVSVPTIVAPGDHLGAVVASWKPAPTPGAITVESRVALMVRVRIPGVAHLDGVVGPLHVKKGSGGRRFSVEVRNTGNLLFTITGQIDVSRGHETVAVVPVNPKEIYIIPKGVARFEAEWSSTPLFGKRTAKATFTLKAFREPDATRKSNVVGMSFFSWLFVIVLLILLIGLVGMVLARRRRSGPGDGDLEGAPIMSGGHTTSMGAHDSAGSHPDVGEHLS